MKKSLSERLGFGDFLGVLCGPPCDKPAREEAERTRKDTEAGHEGEASSTATLSTQRAAGTHGKLCSRLESRKGHEDQPFCVGIV